MICDIKFFNDAKDLCEYLNKTPDKLWELGFDLDDIDFGIITKEKVHQDFDNQDDSWNDEIEFIFDNPLYDLMIKISSFAYRMECVEYNGEYFYIRYH